MRSNGMRTNRIIRPVVVQTSSMELIDLYTYKTETSGNNEVGWRKDYFTTPSTPPVYGDITQNISTQTWELGKNILISSWIFGVNWSTTSFGYSNVPPPGQTITSTGDVKLTITVEALDENEAVLGTVYSAVSGCADVQTITLTNSSITNQTWDLSIPWNGSGSYTGKAHAFKRTLDWTGVCTTDGDLPHPYASTIATGGTFEMSKVV